MTTAAALQQGKGAAMPTTPGNDVNWPALGALTAITVALGALLKWLLTPLGKHVCRSMLKEELAELSDLKTEVAELRVATGRFAEAHERVADALEALKVSGDVGAQTLHELDVRVARVETNLGFDRRTGHDRRHGDTT